MSFKSFALTPISAALLSLAVANSAIAADEKVETVYVSATRSETVQVPIATQIKVIDAEQIRVSGATTVAEVLRTQAGIQIIDADGSGGRNVAIAMRGFSSTAGNNTLVLVDGRKLNNPSLAGPSLNTVSLKDIERIEIIQGSAGVLYGDQAVGGVINVITRQATAGEINGAVSVEGGSDALRSYSASVNQGFENGLNYSVSAQKRTADNFRDNNATDVANVLGNVGFNFTGGRVFVELQKINDDLRLAGSLTDADAAINPRQTKTPKDFSNQDTDLTRLGGEVALGKSWKLIGEFTDRQEDADGYFWGDFSQEMNVKNASPRVVGTIATDKGNSIITLGYDSTKADYKTTATSANYDQTVDGYYGQVIYPLTQQLTANAGIRHASVDDVNKTAKTKRSDSVNASELGLNYQIDSDWRVFGRLADGFRFANADENGYTLVGVSFLDIQKSQSREFGLAWEAQSASVKYSLYDMALDNEISFDPIANANVNLPDSKRKGFLFDGDVVLSGQISLRGNYTYTDAELTEGNLKGNIVPFVAKNTANFGVVFTFIPSLTTAIEANYTGKRYRMDDQTNSADRLDALTLFNVNILWMYKDVELGLRVKNITSEKYADYHGVWGQYPQAGRTYAGHVSYSF
jgi:iron complex outermembrane receptor protein